MQGEIADVRDEKALNGRRDWQLWSVFIFGVGIVGIGLALYTYLRTPANAAAPLTRFFPAFLYGIFALMVLANYYLAQRGAIFEGLRQELVRQKIEAELNREMALMDPVTEVYNRRYVRVILKREVSRVKRYGKGLALMMVDITGFRKVNESLGQAGGDVVLRQVAHLLQSKIRNSDIIIRFGGDEFLLILTDTVEGGVELLASRLKQGIVEWAKSASMTDFDLKFAIGIAHYTVDLRVDQLLAQAEQRMLKDRDVPRHVESSAHAAGYGSPKLIV